ncbi:transcriptional regulator, AraC family [Sporobacter termitidis DSM 10068]|uniref:Transcriptional regulator, AraC family n=1 Tax=Sporobacter termitidis DSM 10068 TaxID=1123282 RepID=A0A1M5YWW4_9FIRM|nr:helix-turn-helix domain-containing protein [Sporobacter termitidis]SHI16340.1 transcriptional regulator, AraC family [Sporobacter termitidis DSM 10068]
MDLLTRMSLALAYVEDNLTGEIDQEALARIACCSSYNFYRMFSFITDISLTEYIRRRRLTLAAIELQSSNVKVIDLALKYGYDSPVSFSRAFQTLHGVTPTEARAGSVTLKAYPRISFQISIKGEKEMDYRIESKEAFQVFGYEGIFKTDGSGLKADILHDNAVHQSNPHEMWNQNHANGAYEKLAADAGDLPPFVSPDLCRIHGVCDYKQTQPGTFVYMQCAFRSKNSRIDGYTVTDIPAYTWVIFPSKKFKWGKVVEVVDNLNKRFYSEWLPTAEYEQANGINLEVYSGDSDMGYVELWYAVKKKV